MSRKQLAYRNEMLRHFYFAGSLSCAELSVLTGKSLPLTTRLLSELLEEGLLVDSGLASSTGGRRPQTYALRPDAVHVLSVAMDQFITRIALMNAENKVVGDIAELEFDLAGDANSLATLAGHLSHFLEQVPVPRETIAGIGIGMPGFVDVTKGLNHSYLKPPAGHSIVSYLRMATDLPVFIDNDSSLIALAESRFGDGRGRANVLVVNVSWGIGLGMVLGGQLFRGDSGFAGEFSHIPVFTNNKMCACGKLGCLETEASLKIMVSQAVAGIAAGRSTMLRQITEEHVEASATRIMQAAVRGDKFSVELIADIGYKIGKGVAILIHIINPGMVVLSGRGGQAGKLWLAPVQQALNEHCIPKISESTVVTVSKMGDSAELIGAASLVFENIELTNLMQGSKLKILSD
ncbi:MAG: ROK family protein [Chitinophagaceae bacterium]|jgi:predicted NBD/HSP70 family sugar kinase|nr:ROK family protein [Chitinophagaceae bacterium]